MRSMYHAGIAFLVGFFAIPGFCNSPEPLYVRPTEVLSFQLCFYWENLPGQPPATDQPVVLQLDVYAQSGWHAHHDSNRPKGTLSGTNFTTYGDGCTGSINYTAPAVAGMHPILITSPPSGYILDIWVAEWANNGTCCYPLSENADLFYKPGGAQPEHPGSYGFNGTMNTVSRMLTIAQQYRQQTGDRLCVNDMSLPSGGIFDLGPAYNGLWWKPPHSEHTKGLNVDLTFGCNSHPQTMYTIAIQNGGGDGPGGIYTHSNHYHLRFAY